MRRPFLLAVLLLVPAAHAATGPTNGCPAPCSGQVSSPEGLRFLYVQPDGVGGEVDAYDPETGEQVFSLPPGITSADGLSHLAAAARTHDTVVSRYRVADSTVASLLVVDGRWQLAGVSPNGRFAALARQTSRGTAVTVVNMAVNRVADRLDLRGNFEVETVSRDGKRLFLIEHLPGSDSPRYLVRLFDLSHDRLASKPLRGKASRA